MTTPTRKLFALGSNVSQAEAEGSLTRPVTLKLPADLAEAVDRLQRDDPAFLRRALAYALMRKSVRLALDERDRKELEKPTP